MKTIGVTSGAIEQVDRTWSRVFPVDMGAATATGETDEWTYAGDWDALYAFAMNKQSELGSLSMQVSATLRRVAGGQAVLTLRTQGYTPTAGGEDGEDGGESGGGEQAGAETEVSVEVTASMEDILTHPKFAAVKWDTGPGIALQKLAAGADPDEEFEWLGTRYSVGEEAQKVDGWELVLRARSYYVPHVVVSVTKAGGGTASVGEVVSKVEGVATAAGVNWLTAGGGASGTGAGRRFVQKYIASGPGGWDKEIYSAT